MVDHIYIKEKINCEISKILCKCNKTELNYPNWEKKPVCFSDKFT